jgi:hypothetical protein
VTGGACDVGWCYTCVTLNAPQGRGFVALNAPRSPFGLKGVLDASRPWCGYGSVSVPDIVPRSFRILEIGVTRFAAPTTIRLSDELVKHLSGFAGARRRLHP